MSAQTSKTDLGDRHSMQMPGPQPLSAADRFMQIGDLIVRETLTPLLVLDLIAHGDIGLVERGFAAVTGFDQRTVQTLLQDRGWPGLRTLYRAANFEQRHMRAILTALSILQEAGGWVAPADRRRHAERCYSRFLTQADHLPAEDLTEVLGLFADAVSLIAKPSEQTLS